VRTKIVIQNERQTYFVEVSRRISESGLQKALIKDFLEPIHSVIDVVDIQLRIAE
jgi:hypothetical protein